MLKKKKLHITSNNKSHYLDLEVESEQEKEKHHEDDEDIDYEYGYGQHAITQWTETFDAAIYGELNVNNRSNA